MGLQQKLGSTEPRTAERICEMKVGLDSFSPPNVNWRNVFDESGNGSGDLGPEMTSPENINRKIGDHEVESLKTMLKILSLEENCSRLSQEMDLCAVTSSVRKNYVTSDYDVSCSHDESSDTCNIPGFISPSSQISISAIRNSWKWVEKLVRCIDTHLRNSSNYHQFFAEYSESDRWMRRDLEKIVESLQKPETKDDSSDAQRILEELENAGLVLGLWRSKVDRVWSLAANVLPVHLRTTDVTDATPARALCHYATKEIEFDENDDLLLLRTGRDNTRWMVSNGRGQKGDVPSVIILIPGTDSSAIYEAVRMRLTLLEQWTNIMKTLGCQIISAMLSLFPTEYSEYETEMLKMLEDGEKKELTKTLVFIEDALKSLWSEHLDCVSLIQRLRLLQNILVQQASAELFANGHSGTDIAFSQAFIVQTNVLCQVITAYQKKVVFPLKELWLQWSVLRISPEVNGHAQTRKLIEKWERENTANRVFFASFWRNETPLDETVKTLEELCKFKIAGIVFQDPGAMALKGTYAPTRSTESVESTEKPDSVFLENRLNEDDDDDEEVDVGIGMETKIANTEQYSSAESEERKKFVIRSVVDPNTREEISLQESIDRGVIRPSEGTYHNGALGEVKPIPVAMKEGLIKVMFTTTKRTKEKKSSVGVITVKTIREQTRPYRVISVVDTRTGMELSREDAEEHRIIDEGRGTYTDRQTGSKILIAEAAQRGLVNIEYCGDVPCPEIISNTYAVHAVFDSGRQKLVTFLDALRRGIVNKESGTYHDTLNGQRMHVSDAISQGFMKTKLVEDVGEVNVDNENIFTVVDASEPKTVIN